MKFQHTLMTSGNGTWTRCIRGVRCHRIELAYVNGDRSFGELRVHFARATWDTKRNGLIYTDPRFLRELRVALNREGLVGHVDYSEQGMQGDGYVSLDVKRHFIKCWDAAQARA
jgi:hypothetical protein